MNSLKKAKYHVSRPLDYIYDPNFHVSHARDHQRAAIESFRRVAEFQICPKFSTMFSDLRNYPPACIKVKCPDKVPPCVDRSWKGGTEIQSAQKVDVAGTHLHLFYCRPNIDKLTSVAFLEEPKKDGEDLKDHSIESERTESETNHVKSRSCGIQTDYRESETQTMPFSPDVIIPDFIQEDTPKLLLLKQLKWGQGLPPGLFDIENIEWELNHKEVKDFLLNPDNVPQSKRDLALEYIHREEWLHREKEIQGIHDLRMELAEKSMCKREEDLSDRLKGIIQRRYENKLDENWKKLVKIRESHRRALRKLVHKQKGITMKYKRPDPITEQADYSSELYGPLMRHGVDPRRRHEATLSLRSKFLHDHKGLEILEQATQWMKTPKVIPLKSFQKEDKLCFRGARWTDEQLLLLQKYFKGLLAESDLDDTKTLPKLMKPIPKPIPQPKTPTLEGIPENEERLYQAALFMQKVIRGRAIQLLMFKGKEWSQDLINEIRSTHALQHKDQGSVNEEKTRTQLEYQEELEEQRKEESFESMVSMLVGDTVGSMLDFLAKELIRLKDERCIHALLLLAERERQRREAAEAGRRQIEERRRREHDETFKQAVKVHQETVDVYLEDIVLNAMDWVATVESRNYIKELARNIDQKTKDLGERKNIWECKELVTDLVYDFMLPEVHKEIMNEKMEKEQESYLKTIQDTVHKTLAAALDCDKEQHPRPTTSNVEDLDGENVEEDTTSGELSLPSESSSAVESSPNDDV